jgi:hypothetical protein
MAALSGFVMSHDMRSPHWWGAHVQLARDTWDCQLMMAMFHQPPHCASCCHRVQPLYVALHVTLRCMSGNVVSGCIVAAGCSHLSIVCYCCCCHRPLLRYLLWPYIGTQPPSACCCCCCCCSCRNHCTSALLSHSMPATHSYQPSLRHCQESCSVHCCHACSSVISLNGRCSQL